MTIRQLIDAINENIYVELYIHCVANILYTDNKIIWNINLNLSKTV